MDKCIKVLEGLLGTTEVGVRKVDEFVGIEEKIIADKERMENHDILEEQGFA